MRKLAITTLALVAILASCQEQPQQQQPQPVGPGNEPAKEEKIPINISAGITTKATDLAFEAGDQIGLYVVNRDGDGTLANSGNHVNNVHFTFTGSQWVGAEEIYWKDQTTHADFYVYYPAFNTIGHVNALPVEVAMDQTDAEGYRSGDVLWGTKKDVAPTSEAVMIQTAHVMSNLLIYLEAGNGYNAETLRSDVESLVINNTLTHGALNLADGSITANGTAADITPMMEGDHYRALIVPQTVSDKTMISLKVDGYAYSLKQTITFKPNMQHKCTLKVNKTTEGINIGITGWETDENDYGGTVN